MTEGHQTPPPLRADSAPRSAAEDPSAELEQFLYVITHDLRASFRAFQTLPDWIREDMGPLPPERAELVGEHLDMLETQAARCERMLLDLRDYSRVGRLAEPDTRHGLAEIVSRAQTLFPLPGGFRLTLAGDGTLVGPGNELAQLFAALLSNAVKHHDRPEGEIRIQATGPGPMRRISVSDDGPGIPARFHEVVFDPLRTLRPRDQCEGSGMGLTTARKIVNRLGGTIRIVPQPGAGDDGEGGRGTTVAFTLPGQPETEAEAPPRLH